MLGGGDNGCGSGLLGVTSKKVTFPTHNNTQAYLFCERNVTIIYTQHQVTLHILFPCMVLVDGGVILIFMMQWAIWN